MACNVLLRDMNVDVPLTDGRRKVLANGLPIWQGAQAADAQPQADRVPGTVLEQAAKRKRHRTYPQLAVRWMGMLAVAAQRALAYSLLELPLAGLDERDGTEPPLGDLLADARDAEAVPASRFPAP